MIDTQRCKLRDTSSARILYLSYILIVFPRIYLVCTYEVFCNCRVTVWQLFSFLYEVFFSCVFKLVCLHLIGWYGVVLTAAVYLYVFVFLFVLACFLVSYFYFFAYIRGGRKRISRAGYWTIVSCAKERKRERGGGEREPRAISCNRFVSVVCLVTFLSLFFVSFCLDASDERGPCMPGAASFPRFSRRGA